MNRRILKKLSKKAMPILEQLDCLKYMQTGVSDGDDASWQFAKFDRKHLKHFRGKTSNWISELRGTPWVGSGDSYSGDWSDWSAWQYLLNIVDGANLRDWMDDFDEWPEVRFKLRNPADVFWFSRLLITEEAIAKAGGARYE